MGVMPTALGGHHRRCTRFTLFEARLMVVATLSAERRRAARRQPTLGTFLRLEPIEGQGKRLGLVWNISASGISLLFNQLLSAGTVLRGDLVTYGSAGLPEWQLYVRTSALA